MLSFAVRLYDIGVAVHIAAVVIAFGVTFTYPLVNRMTAARRPAQHPCLHRSRG